MNAIVQGLAQISGAAIPRVVDFEMGKILGKCVSSTPSATEDSIIANARGREWGTHKTGFVPRRKFRGQPTKNGFKKYKYANRYPDALWNEIARQRLASIQSKIGHINLSKQSWLKLAEMLGLEIKAAAKVRKMPQNFNANFNTSRVKGEGSYSVSISNNQPTVKAIGGRGILEKAVAGRAMYFQKNLEKGVLEDMAAFARAYPGLVVTAPGGGLQ